MLDITMAVVVAGLFGVGLHLLLQRSLMRVLLGFVIVGHGANLLLLLAGGPVDAPPVVAGDPAPDPGRYTDPLPQAMALTAIVITFGVTTLLLAQAYRAWRSSGHDEVRDDIEDRRVAGRAEETP